MTKELVTRWFNKLSVAERNKPLLILNGLAYTPQATYDEVMRGTPVGDKLQNLIEQGKYGTTFQEEQELMKQRLTMDLESKPPDKILFVALSSSGTTLPPTKRAFTAKQLLEEIKNGTTLGRQWLNNEASYMKRLMQVR